MLFIVNPFLVRSKILNLIVHPLAVQSFCAASAYLYYISPMATNGMRGAAGGRQPAAAKPRLYIYVGYPWWCAVSALQPFLDVLLSQLREETR